MILERLKKVFAVVLPDGDLSSVTRKTKLAEDLGISSISLLLLAIATEEEFGIEFDTLKADSLVCVGDVCDYIEGKLAQ